MFSNILTFFPKTPTLMSQFTITGKTIGKEGQICVENSGWNQPFLF